MSKGTFSDIATRMLLISSFLVLCGRDLSRVASFVFVGVGGSVECAGDQEVAGSILAGSGNILSWRLIMKYFLRSFSPFR